MLPFGALLLDSPLCLDPVAHFPHEQGSSFNAWSHRPSGCLSWWGGRCGMSISLSPVSWEVLGLLLVRNSLIWVDHVCRQSSQMAKAFLNHEEICSYCSCLSALEPLPSPVGSEGINPWNWLR